MTLRIRLLGCALAFLCGCGDGSEEQSYSLVPVSGTVSLDGKPLAGAKVTFLADASNKPRTDGDDISGPDGSFLIMYRNRRGLSPGKYKVTVGQPKAEGGASEALGDDPLMAQLGKEAAAAGKARGKALPPPWPYESPDKTPLSHEVSAKGDTGLKFDLKSSLK